MRPRTLTLFLVLLTACSKPPMPPALRVGIGGDPGTLDPHAASSLVEVSLCKNLYEGLYRVGPGGVLRPGLATGVEISDGGMLYTFFLREARWSNGDLLTAVDVANSWRRALDPATGTPLGALLEPVRAVRALDETTFVVELKRPVPYFLQSTAHPLLAAFKSTELSSGPFSVESWKPGAELAFRRNPHYWRAAEVSVERLVFVTAPDPTTALALWEEGELDWVGSPLGMLPTEALDRLPWTAIPAEATFWYKFNTSVPPLDNVSVRRALSLAIDREALIANIAHCPHQPSCGPVPPCFGLKSPTSPVYDPELAAALVADLGPLPPITILVGAAGPYRAMAQAIQDQWLETLGLEVHLQAVEFKTLLSRMAAGDYQVAGKVWFADVSDPSDFLVHFADRSSAKNETGWEHLEFQRIMALAQSELDSAERRALLSEAEQLFVDECPAACIYHPCFPYVESEKIADCSLPPSSALDFSWITRSVE